MPEFVEDLTSEQFEYVLAVINGRLRNDGVGFEFWRSKTSKRYDPPIAYLIRAIISGELPTAHEWLVMADEERSRWDYLVDSGVLAFFAENYPEGVVEKASVRASG
jgi:hypothetical protein